MRRVYVGIMGGVMGLFMSSVADQAASIAKGGGTFLPPAAFKAELTEADHPDAAVIGNFLAAKRAMGPVEPTGLDKKEYLRLISEVVRGLRIWQHESGPFEGDIVDPWYEGDHVFGSTGEPGNRYYRHYATPHYAHAVSVLLKSGYSSDPELLESGARAMEASIRRMLKGRERGGMTSWICGDFYPYAMMHAYWNFEGLVEPERFARWTEDLRGLDIGRAVGSPAAKSNWVVVSHTGDYLRAMAGLTTPDRAEAMLADKRQYFTERGTWNFESYTYDTFPRYQLTGMLDDGYRGTHFEFYRDRLWRGSWVSLLTQSPFGKQAMGFRSAHHIWNEAQLAALFEIYAAEHAREGLTEWAEMYKRAARLALHSMGRRLREDGSFFIVDNRVHPKERHGFEMYSLHTCYNALTAHMLARAWQSADDAIREGIAPADAGGFVYVLYEDYRNKFPPPVHNYKCVFAHVAGTQVQYSMDTELFFEPIGIQRIHLRGASPIIGPSDGLAAKFGDKQTWLAVGPGWIDADGQEQRLAGAPIRPEITVLEESPERVRFQADFLIPMPVEMQEEARGALFDARGVAVTDGAFDFSGGNSLVASRERVPYFEGDWTLSLDFRQHEVATGPRTLAALFIEGMESHALLLEVDPVRGLRGLFRSPPGTAGGTNLFSGQPVSAGRWHQAALRRSGDRLELELNGAIVASGNAGPAIDAPLHLLLGRLFRENNQRQFNGQIRNVRLVAGDAEMVRLPLSELPGEARLHLRQTVTLEEGRVTVEDELLSGEVAALTVNYPFIIDDGEEQAQVRLDGATAEMTLYGLGSRVTLLEPEGVFEHVPLRLLHENGWMDLLRAEVPGRRAVYVIEAAK